MLQLWSLATNKIWWRKTLTVLTLIIYSRKFRLKTIRSNNFHVELWLHKYMNIFFHQPESVAVQKQNVCYYYVASHGICTSSSIICIPSGVRVCTYSVNKVYARLWTSFLLLISFVSPHTNEVQLLMKLHYTASHSLSTPRDSDQLEF